MVGRFAAPASAFDAAGQVSGWALTNALLDARLAGRDTEAIGGDLAYQLTVADSFLRFFAFFAHPARAPVERTPQGGIEGKVLKRRY